MEVSSQHPRTPRLCPDVLQEVLSYFDPLVIGPAPAPEVLRHLMETECGRTERQRSQASHSHRTVLARCARVCKEWSDPARILLWSVLPNGPGPLVRALTISEGVSMTSKYGTKLVDLRGLSDANWQRWLWYASCVRYLLFHQRIDEDSWYPAFFKATLERNADVPALLSNLKILTWRSSDCARYSAMLRSIAPPNLSMFCIAEIDSRGVAVEDDLNTMRVACTKLQHLCIWRSRHSHPAYEHLYPRIPQFNNLRSLELPTHSNGEDLARLAELSHLSLLDVRLPIGTDHIALQAFTNPFTNMRARAFHPLQTLSLSGHHVLISAFLSRIAPNRLNSLSLNFRFSRGPTGQGEELPYQLFALPYLSRSLTTLYLVTTVGAIRTERSLSELLRALQPNLTHLKDVTFILNAYIAQVTDGELHDIARAWPHLVRFVLRFGNRKMNGPDGVSSEGNTTRPSFRAAVRLACACSELETMQVESKRPNEDDEHELIAMLSHGAQQGKLRTLDLLARPPYYAPGSADHLRMSYGRCAPGIYEVDPGRRLYVKRDTRYVKVDHNSIVDLIRQLFPRAERLRFGGHDNTHIYTEFDSRA